MRSPVQFGEADLEDDFLGESSASCSYPPASEDEEGAEPSNTHSPSTSLRVPAPSAALLQLSGVADEPLRETHAPFRVVLRDAQSESPRATEPPASIEEALVRAARSSFASAPPHAPGAERASGVRFSAPRSIEEAVLRVTESRRLDTEEPVAEEPLRERYIPNA